MVERQSLHAVETVHLFQKPYRQACNLSGDQGIPVQCTKRAATKQALQTDLTRPQPMLRLRLYRAHRKRRTPTTKVAALVTVVECRALTASTNPSSPDVVATPLPELTVMVVQDRSYLMRTVVLHPPVAEGGHEVLEDGG